ncbi:hypothetical protein M569_16616 [Genlisea aurea]|uniref:Uncharacterized protein n=1 Tax=Genlisea aurea TaxID=192259 RepID=S8BUZ9_9LAMI|nr:hypothetical protein M569_16616 [Genlisea aurea]
MAIKDSIDKTSEDLLNMSIDSAVLKEMNEPFDDLPKKVDSKDARHLHRLLREKYREFQEKWLDPKYYQQETFFEQVIREAEERLPKCFTITYIHDQRSSYFLDCRYVWFRNHLSDIHVYFPEVQKTYTFEEPKPFQVADIKYLEHQLYFSIRRLAHEEKKDSFALFAEIIQAMDTYKKWSIRRPNKPLNKLVEYDTTDWDDQMPSEITRIAVQKEYEEYINPLDENDDEKQITPGETPVSCSDREYWLETETE